MAEDQETQEAHDLDPSCPITSSSNVSVAECKPTTSSPRFSCEAPVSDAKRHKCDDGLGVAKPASAPEKEPKVVAHRNGLICASSAQPLYTPIPNATHPSSDLYLPSDLVEALQSANVQNAARSLNSSASKRYATSETDEPLKTLCVRNLPSWADEESLKNLFLSASSSVLESMFHQYGPASSAHPAITSVDIVRDPTTNHCVGYGYVEFANHKTAVEMLALSSNPNFTFPGINRALTVEWAVSTATASNLLQHYQFYLGNLRAGLTDRTVLQILQKINSAVTSVRLIPSELLGPAPEYRPRLGRNTATSGKDGSNSGHNILAATSAAFYCGATYCSSESTGEENGNSFGSTVEKQASAQTCTPRTAAFQDHRWCAGFVRLNETSIPKWKSILRDIREALQSPLGRVLERPVAPADSQTAERQSAASNHPHNNDKNTPSSSAHPATAIVLRPIFGQFEDQSRISSGAPSEHARHSHTTGVVSAKSGFRMNRRSDQPDSRARSATQNQHKTTVFVGNLAEDVKDEDLSLLFSPFGTILSVRVAFLKHVGFVEMADHRSALAALSHLRGAALRRQKLHLDWGRTRHTAAFLPSASRQAFDFELTRTPHAYISQEKTYAARWLQAMRPHDPSLDAATLSVTQSTQTGDSTGHQPDSKFWLASLCMSLPQRPPDAQDDEDDTDPLTATS